MVNVSIIVTCEEKQQSQLRNLLPELLSMQYEGEYEVIVVDEKHDKDFEEWLADVEIKHPHLSHTFCPASAIGIDVHRLALMLGAKAANNEWLVLLPVDARSQAGDWLPRLTSSAGEGHDVVIGCTGSRNRWNWAWRLFRHFLPPPFPWGKEGKGRSSLILCRRVTLLKAEPVKLSNCGIVKM